MLAVEACAFFLPLGQMIQGIHIGLGAGHKNIRMRAASHGGMPVLLDAHGHFAQGVGAAGDGVDGVLLQLRLAAHHIGDDVEQGVHRPHAEARAALQAVTKDDVRAILRKLTLSVSYLLTKEVAAHAAE